MMSAMTQYRRFLIATQFLTMVTICSAHDFTELWFETQVDHFGFANNDRFKLRYLVNISWWDHNGGPIFFYTGNEGDIELFWNNTGFPFDIATEFSALIVFAEHRYYGKSQPYTNCLATNASCMGYLSSEQALADYADLLTSLREQLPGAENSAVVAFGGSYGGMLSAWMRIKYPHIVQGSIAASAPILQFTDLTACSAFGHVVTRTFAAAATTSNGSSDCTKAIRLSWSAIDRVMHSEKSRMWLTDKWHLCEPLKDSSQRNAIKAWLANIYTNLAMVDYPYPANFLAHLPAFPVKEACARVHSYSPGDDRAVLSAIFNIIDLYFNFTGQASCIDTSSQGTESLDDKGWDYQSCTEMVMPMCYDGTHDMFEPRVWDLAVYSRDCHARYGVWPRARMAQLIYGGRNINHGASNIVFSNGLLDPWSSGGVMHSLSDSLVAIIIKDGAHHLDLRSANPADPADVKAARNLERRHILHWVKQHNPELARLPQQRIEIQQ